ncbi:MAG TPA: M20/M25/M40 family metallo-hydrolase [Dehalococcoidia bacterium]|nr:M20/M25/M40 family metallo-hydrolase [Dehalococcoidia bacterium]
MSTPDWDVLAKEATDLLQRYIRVNTTNPPGNEAMACDFLEAALVAEGIECRRLTSAPGRDNLYADLPCSEPDAKPLILLNHTDVVPVESAHWSVDPFAGVIKDGYLWGRGALDMKGMGILELVAFLTLKRRGVRLRRPVRFFAVADEEAGSEYGVEWLDRHHPETLDAAFVLNEGGYGSSSYLGIERPLFGISMAEKSPLWLTLKATGRPGHGSTPHDDNVLDRLVRGMQRVQAWQRPLTLTPPVADALRAARAEGYVDVDPDKASADEIANRYRQLRILLSNTISATGLHSGMKHNVIPATASATLDCRLVPGYGQDRFIAELRRVIDDPKVQIETVFAAESPPTPPGGELVDAIREVVGSVMPEAPLLPRVTAGFTDSRTFRRRGIPAYGFVPMLLAPDEQGGMHGNDERISLRNLRLGVEVLYRVVERVCVG